MKTLTGVITLVLALMFGTSNGVIAAEHKGQPMGVEKKPPATGEKTVDKASPKLMKVKVLEVNEKAKTLTVMFKGKPKTLNAPDLKSLPKAGDVIDIAVSDAGGGCTDWYDQHHQLHHCSNK